MLTITQRDVRAYLKSLSNRQIVGKPRDASQCLLVRTYKWKYHLKKASARYTYIEYEDTWGKTYTVRLKGWQHNLMEFFDRATSIDNNRGVTKTRFIELLRDIEQCPRKPKDQDDFEKACHRFEKLKKLIPAA